MLTSDQLDVLIEPVTELYEEYNQTIINDIARRLTKMGRITETAAWQLQRVTESGKVYENAIKEISQLTGISQRKLREMFEKAGVKAIRFDDKIYEAAGLKPLPLNLSPAMAAVLSAGLDKTQGAIRNMTLSTAVAAQRSFIAHADLAYLQVTSGAMTYQEAIRAAVKGVASEGLSVIEFSSGQVDKLDVAMRRTVLTGVGQTTGRLQERRADEMGSDLVQVSAHTGARPSHADWQGKIFSRSGTHKKYPDFVSSTGYGTGAGLCGWNCRHSFFPFFEGLSPEIYKGAELESFKRKAATVPGGHRVSLYDATQIQRAIERKIRFWKRQASALEAAGLENVFEVNKIREWQLRMRQFIQKSRLDRQYEREQIQ